jgi:hypothetical protein
VLAGVGSCASTLFAPTAAVVAPATANQFLLVIFAMIFSSLLVAYRVCIFAPFLISGRYGFWLLSITPGCTWKSSIIA